MFLRLLPQNLSQAFKDHSKDAETFRESKSVEDLKEFLLKIFSPHIHNLVDAPRAHINLQNVWRKLQLHKLHILIKCFFPTCDHLALTKAINITCSSVHITYFMIESPKEIEDLILCNRKKLAFMQYIGVYELCINGVSILQSNSDDSFNFDTALLEAAQAKQAEVIEFILRIESCSADTIITKSMENILITLHCHGNCNESIIEILINNYPNNLYKKVFILAAQKGFIEIVLKFLQRKINPNTQDNDGQTALMLASLNGHQQVVELLLNQKADPNIQSNDGTTALMLASQNGHQQVVELLLNEKTDPNIQSNDGWTVLVHAKSIIDYHNLTPELLFKNGTKLKQEYLYGEARVIELESVNGLAETATAACAIILKTMGDNWYLLYEGDEVTEETLHSLDDGLSELLDIDMKITADLLNVFLQPEPDEGLVEKMMLEISKVWYLNFLKNGHEMTDGSDDYESDEGYVIIPGVKRITKEIENEFWEEAFCGPFRKEIDPFPSAEQAEGIAAKLLKIDDLNSAGISISALIEAVRQGTYRSMSFVLQMLLLGINPNQYKLPDGDTALHVAVRQKNEVVVKLLLAFKADPNIKNKIGEIPIDLAGNKKEIFDLLDQASTRQAKTREYFASNPNLPEGTRTGTYLMSLDGGGVCQFNSITFLIALEERMKELSPQCLPIYNYFDYMAGTSSGAIAALTLLYTNHSLRIGRCLVYQILIEVFSLNDIDKRKNSIERNLQSIFKGKVMSSLKRPPHAIVTTTKHPDGMLCLMTSYGSNSEIGANHHVWKAAQMSSAAPLIFPPVDDKYYDGGLMANDPTNAALGEISEIEQNCEFGCVLSIGTGSFENAKLLDDLEYFCWNFPFDQFLKLIKACKAAMIISNYAKAKELSNEKSAKSSCETKGWKYHRWSPPLSRNLGPACKELNVIIDMMYDTEMHILHNPETIDNIAKCILARKTRPN